jgi:hypothetical protein
MRRAISTSRVLSPSGAGAVVKTHEDAVRPQVDVGSVILQVGELGDGLHEAGPDGKQIGGEERTGSTVRNPPITATPLEKRKARRRRGPELGGGVRRQGTRTLNRCLKSAGRPLPPPAAMARRLLSPGRAHRRCPRVTVRYRPLAAPARPNLGGAPRAWEAPRTAPDGLILQLRGQVDGPWLSVGDRCRPRRRARSGHGRQDDVARSLAEAATSWAGG